MAHFAKVKDGVVVDVIVAEPEFFDTFVDSTPGQWIQTSYNTRGGKHYDQDGNESADQSKALRKNYAGVGYLYDHVLDAFMPPKPYPSWTLDENTCWWVAPVAYPEDGNQYNWNEANQTWDLIVEE